jgi:hypothetical protein
LPIFTKSLLYSLEPDAYHNSHAGFFERKQEDNSKKRTKSMHHQDTFHIIGTFLSLCLIAILSACTQHTATLPPDDSPIKEPSMNLNQPISFSPSSIPPIDADTPLVFETATFGLG